PRAGGEWSQETTDPWRMGHATYDADGGFLRSKLRTAAEELGRCARNGYGVRAARTSTLSPWPDSLTPNGIRLKPILLTRETGRSASADSFLIGAMNIGKAITTMCRLAVQTSIFNMAHSPAAIGMRPGLASPARWTNLCMAMANRISRARCSLAMTRCKDSTTPRHGPTAISTIRDDPMSEEYRRNQRSNYWFLFA